MENSTSSPPLLKRQQDVTTTEGIFRGSTLRFINRLDGKPGTPRQKPPPQHQQHEQQIQQLPQEMRKSLHPRALNMLSDAAKDILSRGVCTQVQQGGKQLLVALHEEQVVQRRPSQEKKRQDDEHLQRKHEAAHPQHRRRDEEPTFQQGRPEQQNGRVPPGRRVGCTLKPQNVALSGKGKAVQTLPVASYSASPDGTLTLTAETGRPAGLGRSADASANRELHVSEELPVIYAHSVAFKQALPVGRLIPQNVRPPPSQVAASLGPARVPPVLTGSPFFHCAPSSPQCPVVSPHAPTLAALPEPLVDAAAATEEAENKDESWESISSAEPAARNAAAAVSGGASTCCAAPPAVTEDEDSTPVTTRPERSPQSVETAAVAALPPPSLPAAAAAPAGAVSPAPHTNQPVDLLPAAAAETAAPSVAGAAAELQPGSEQCLETMDPLLKQEKQRRRAVQQHGTQKQQQQQTKKRDEQHLRGLKVITVPHQHAALYNYTVATLKRRLEETGQLSAVCPSGIYLHEQLRSQEQPAFFAVLNEVNKNAADAAYLSARWQQCYSSDCLGLPAAAAAKLKERQQKKDGGPGHPGLQSGSGNSGSTQFSAALSASSLSSSRSAAAASSSSSPATAHILPAYEKVLKPEGDTAAAQRQSSGAPATTQNEMASPAAGLEKKNSEKKRLPAGRPAVVNVATAPATSAAAMKKSVEALTVEDLVIKPGPPPSAAWMISSAPAAAATATPSAAQVVQLQQQQQHGQLDHQLPPAAAADAAGQYQYTLAGTVQQQQQQLDCSGSPLLQYHDPTAAPVTGGNNEAFPYMSVDTGVYGTDGGVTNNGSDGLGQIEKEKGEAPGGSAREQSRVYLLQQQLEAQEKKVKQLERMLAQQRAAYLATRPFVMKSLRLPPSRASDSSSRDDRCGSGSTCSSQQEEGVTDLQEWQHRDSRSSSAASNRAAFATTKPERGEADRPAAAAKTSHLGRHEKDDLDAQVRRFLASKTSLPTDKILRQVKRGVYIFGDTKALVTKERSGKIICEVLQYGEDVSDFAEEYKGKRLSLDRFWRLVSGRGLYRNT